MCVLDVTDYFYDKSIRIGESIYIELVKKFASQVIKMNTVNSTR